MEKLTVKEAEKLARLAADNMPKGTEQEFSLWHAKAVGDIAVILAKGKKVDYELLKIAGLVHDIGRAEVDERHAEKSLEILKKKYDISTILEDCILNHGSDGNPKTEEGKLIKAADKICIINSEVVDMVIKDSGRKIKENDIKFLKKMTFCAIELLEKLEW